MPRFHLTFEYPGTCGETVVGKPVTVTRETLQDAAEYCATQRRLTSIHIRTCNGEVVEREFTFGPSERAA
jgi:hypothetical protein